jgi:hypothetical protein
MIVACQFARGQAGHTDSDVREGHHFRRLPSTDRFSEGAVRGLSETDAALLHTAQQAFQDHFDRRLLRME